MSASDRRRPPGRARPPSDSAPGPEPHPAAEDDWAEAFDLFDRDGDGAISAAELAAAMRSLGERPGPEEVEALLRSADLDGNGVIDRREFASLMARIAGGARDALGAAFASFDRDGDGYISVDELRAALRGLGEEIDEAEARALLRAADRDGDGRLDFEEFKAIMSR